MTPIIIAGAVLLILVLIYFLLKTDSFGLCPRCGNTAVNNNCPKCPITASCKFTPQDAQKALSQLSIGCATKLRAIIRENMVSVQNVQDFLSAGDKKMVVATNVDPETFLKMANSADELKEKIRVVVLASEQVGNQRMFISLQVSNGKATPSSTPTTDFATAFNTFNTQMKSVVGADGDNLIFYIDEDLPCGPNPFAIENFELKY